MQQVKKCMQTNWISRLIDWLHSDLSLITFDISPHSRLYSRVIAAQELRIANENNVNIVDTQYPDGFNTQASM